MYSVSFEHIPESSSRPLCGSLGRPRLLTMNYIQASQQPDWTFYMHAHEHELEISYVLSGKGALYCAGRFYELTPGDIVVKNPNISHAENSDPGNPIEQVCFLIDGLQAEGLPENEFPLDNLPPVIQAIRHRPLLDALSQDLLAATIRKKDPDMAYVHSLLELFLYVCHEEVRSTVSERKNDKHGALMEEIRAYLDTAFNTDISLDELSNRFHISVYYLSRQFKKYTGYTINQYLVSCRIGEAQRRLIFQTDRIDEIADKSGFKNLSYFYSSFRKNVGCTPTEYRNAYRQKGIA